MRIGGPVPAPLQTPDAWVEAHHARGYRAAYCPIVEDVSLLADYVTAARDADIVIAEVGAWSNPLSPDEGTRAKALTLCKERLALADAAGARCCVNIAGSRSADSWFGPHADNLSEDTFDMIVASVREIIDAVKPTRTFYTLETMQWIFPDSVETYLRLIKAIDRARFGVHFDAVNLITSPRVYFNNGALIDAFLRALGPSIKSCHAKDVLLEPKLGLIMSEVIPGRGALDYPALLRGLSALDPDMPLMLEHLSSDAEYATAAQHLRTVAASHNLA